jgi:hypothetical protein
MRRFRLGQERSGTESKNSRENPDMAVKSRLKHGNFAAILRLRRDYFNHKNYPSMRIFLYKVVE